MELHSYRCRKVVGGVAEGPALVADTRISFWGGFDPVTGKIVEVGNPLEGESLEGKVVVFRSTKGSSGSSRMLRLARISGRSPVAFINLELDELSVLSCVAQDLPLVIGMECNPFDAIMTGDWVKVDADRGIVEVRPQKPRPAMEPSSASAAEVSRPGARIGLTGEQQSMLDGASGQARADHLRRLIAWGEAFGAERLVPVESVMMNGVSVPNRTLGDLPAPLIDGYVDYVKSCLSTPARVPTCCQASQFDLDRAAEQDSDVAQAPAQKEMIEAASKSGIAMTWTCAPYLIGNVPVKGQICAWTESHAVIYINSILGARSTRNGNESTAAAAATGWFPEFGVLRTENRRARLLVRVETPLGCDADWGCLGFFAGKKAGLRIPAFTGLRSPRLESARQLAAAIATSGGAPMFHIVGVTPEAPTQEAAFQGQEPDEIVTFGPDDLAHVYETLTTATGQEIDFVYFGCPHATVQEIVELAGLLRGKKVHSGVRLLVSMGYAVEMQARRLGFIQEIERAGGQIMGDSCPTNILWPHPKRMATPAIKTGYYAQNLLGCEAVLAPAAECVRIAIEGRIVKEAGPWR
jgi:predicted aconitase/predicted aconitase with swiveling domain